jgi:hypothetical protein
MPAACLNGNPALGNLIIALCRVVVLILLVDFTDGRRTVSGTSPSWM